MRKLVRAIETQEALDKPAEAITVLVRRLLSKVKREQNLRDLLEGVWLHHPLHPVLVTLPLGAWSLAGLLDAASIFSRRPNKTSTLLLSLGTGGVLLAAPTGLADWTQMNGAQKRVGLIDAALNSVAVPFFLLSLCARLRGKSGRF